MSGVAGDEGKCGKRNLSTRGGGCLALMLLVLAPPLLLLRWWDDMADAYYSADYISNSVAASKARKLFVAQPRVETPSIVWGGQRHRVTEAWIERAAVPNYRKGISRAFKNLGYHLVVRVQPEEGRVSSRRPKDDVGLWYNLQRLKHRTTYDPSHSFYWTRITEPFPQSVRITAS